MLEWLEITRNQAEERFRSLPFPSGKDENFRFTTIDYSPAQAAASGSLPLSLAAVDPEEAAALVIDGEEGRASGTAPGVLFTDVLRAATLGSEAVRLRLKEDQFRDDKFAQLTSARWKNGAFLHVPAGVKLGKPVRFVTCARGPEEHYRNILVLEEGAEATVVQECWSDGQARFAGELTEVRLGRNARLHWVVLQAYGDATSAVVRQRIELGEAAELTHTPLHLGGRMVQVRQETHLTGSGASIETQAAARGHGAQHFDFWLDARHEAAGSRSKMDYWFVMAGKARGVFNGLIEVKRGAGDCESAQRSKSLLLGGASPAEVPKRDRAGGASPAEVLERDRAGGATVHSIPKLIIKTDAVKASHGASVSSVSGEQLHYLQSRGIPRAEAERMIVRGFTEGVVERLPTESLRGRADALLDGKQGGAHG